MDRFNTKLLPPSLTPWTPKQDESRQIAVLMSGGVDSSVTAHLLSRAGWEVLGITMKIPVACGTRARGCCGADAAFVCHELGIPHYFIDVTGAFEELIIRRFRAAYAAGQTPNPCADCNAMLKFSLVWDLLEETFGITRLATGHYARVIDEDGAIRLRMAKDKDKDQSYFLYGIPGRRLADLVLPLGEMTKKQVRAIASALGLSVAQKAESMELCFAGEGDYRPALGDGDMNLPGDITDMEGRKIGEHKGIANYTLGQRRGLGVAGGQPLYVGRIDARTNTVALGTKEQVSSRIVRATELNILLPEHVGAGPRACPGQPRGVAPTADARLFGKIRSYGPARPCTVVDLAPERITVEFEQPQFAPCPGQRLVLYDEHDNVVAGGTIVTDNG